MSQQSGPGEKLVSSVNNLVGALVDRAGSVVSDRIGQLTDRLNRFADPGAAKGVVEKGKAGVLDKGKDVAHGATSPGHGLASGAERLKHGAGQLWDKLSGGGGKDPRVTNIVESVDVGVPVRIAYDQWTQFTDFPSFMKKVEHVEQDSDEKLTWKAQILGSHRAWQSTILEQVPDERIVWRSEGPKGSVDGAVSFHELAEDLTRILVVLEYHPRGLLERTGNLWRAQGRRVRLELKQFVRHVMTETILDPDRLRGWRGEIREGRVVLDDEAAWQREQREAQREQRCDGEAEKQGRQDQPGGGADQGGGEGG